MLLIVVGVVNLIKRHFFGGVITIAVGAYFLLPEISWVEGEWLDMFWPVCYFVGIMILFKPERHHFNAHWDGRRPEYTKEVYGSEDGLSYRTTLSDRFSRLFWTLCSEGRDLGMRLAGLSWIYGGASWKLPRRL